MTRANARVADRPRAPQGALGPPQRSPGRPEAPGTPERPEVASQGDATSGSSGPPVYHGILAVPRRGGDPSFARVADRSQAASGRPGTLPERPGRPEAPGTSEDRSAASLTRCHLPVAACSPVYHGWLASPRRGGDPGLGPGRRPSQCASGRPGTSPSSPGRPEAPGTRENGRRPADAGHLPVAAGSPVYHVRLASPHRGR